ncbi:hypothetical protein [Mycolicibacterium cosmeticum]|jgi:hypothetical protein|uniref:hypothetical protein n=1 Tax=Mycolicibacterium cosmeticum TaxID=258533 RepID=UPI0003FBA827
MSILGDWDVTIRTPVGSLRVVYGFSLENGVLTGEAVGKHETVRCVDIVADGGGDGQHVRWRQTVTKPMKLNLEFDVQVDGDRLSGHSRAGRLPRSTVTGTRRR